MSAPARLLGIDHGLRVIGLAVSDPTGVIARPLRLLERTSKRADFEAIRGLIAEMEIVGCVVGLPVSPPEVTAYTQADRVRLWTSRLAAAVPAPVYLWNERYSSQEAEDLLLERGEPLPERVDAVAAAVILQSFLDSMREPGMAWPERVLPAEA